MGTRVIACGVFRTDLTAILPESDELRITFLEGGLHSEPNRLRETIQREIDSEDRVERIVLLYGLCGTGLAGLRARRIPLVIPRVHDCISLFLGSDSAYARQFRTSPGTYYISAGWYEEQVQPKGKKREAETEPSTGTIQLSTADHSAEDLEAKYGRENAAAILEFTQSWKRNYRRAVFIDTGSGDRKKYRGYVEAIGKEFGWETETLPGSPRLIRKALTAEETDDEILIVPPGQVSYVNPAEGKLSSGDPDSPQKEYSPLRRSRIIPGLGTADHARRRMGLGIDAGGTYTDAALFDIKNGRVIAKAKALTTPWDYTEGIAAALGKLPPDKAAETEIVAVSTTLATNAIVEDNRQAVGLLLMPLGGALPAGIEHHPVKVVSGRMTITGEVLEELNEEEIRTAAEEMVQTHGVRAFAVSGYGGTVNPAHEKEVARIIRDATGLMACAGHELSGQLDFTVRASTAVLNAGIIPHLENFFHAAENCLTGYGIDAPVLFVRGDGFLMNASYAMEHPIETALSGPAASVAGARYLTGLEEAAVVDVGGTTSDIGYIRGGVVESDPDGAMIGTHRTHVQAVDMVTLGLGGDSEILFDRGTVSVGPRRVTPLCRLGEKGRRILKDLAARIDDLGASSSAAAIIRFTGKTPPFTPTRTEKAALEALSSGPLPVLDLARRAGLGHWRFLKLQRLLSVRSIEPMGLTPTDLLHLNGRISLGARETAQLGLELHAALAGIEPDEYTRRVWRIAEDTIAGGVTAKLLNIPPEDPAIALLVGGGSKRAKITVRPTAPIIGLGAAAPFMLEGLKKSLGMEALIPENADVANALGAITSSVHAAVAGSVIPAAPRGFRITGSDGTVYEHLNEAEAYLEQRLIDEVREKAAAAGTSETAVTLSVRDRLGMSAEGDTILLERCMEAEIRGLPDLF